MAIYRQVHTSFWQDDFVLGLTPEGKYFYLYLLTNSKTKQCGIYEIPKKVMELETGYNSETIDKLIKKFIEYGKIKYNSETKEICLLNWIKYNPFKSPKIKICVEKELKEVKDRSMIQYVYGIQGVSQKEKEEEKKEEYNNLDDIHALWIKTWGRNPKHPEIEETVNLIDRFGIEKTEKIFRQAVLEGFHKLKTLIDSLDSKGDIIPKNHKNNSQESKLAIHQYLD